MSYFISSINVIHECLFVHVMTNQTNKLKVQVDVIKVNSQHSPSATACE